MAKCAKCQNSGLTLKLDFDGYCLACHNDRLKVLDSVIAEQKARINELQAFHDEYMCIPEARDEAEKIISIAKGQARHIVAEAEEKANDLNSRAESMLSTAETIRDQADQTAKLVLAELDNRISLLLQESAKEFHYRARGRMAEHYSKSKSADSILASSCNFTALTVPAFKKLLLANGYITFDLETTGLSAKRDHIIEIGAIRYDNNMVETGRFETLVNPQCEIPEAATKVNGITYEMVKDAPTIDAAMADFLKFLGDGEITLVAHNAPFDIAFLEAALNKLAYTLTAGYVDSITIAKKAFKLKSYSLESVCNRIEYYNMNAHRAIGDADAVNAIVMECVDF